MWLCLKTHSGGRDSNGNLLKYKEGRKYDLSNLAYYKPFFKKLAAVEKKPIAEEVEVIENAMIEPKRRGRKAKTENDGSEND